MNELPDQNTIIVQWIQKAENDIIAANQIIALSKNCPFDTVCFHAQQCIEKYLKALLLFHKVDFPKSHDIDQLIELLPNDLKTPLTLEERSKITYYAVASRVNTARGTQFRVWATERLTNSNLTISCLNCFFEKSYVSSTH